MAGVLFAALLLPASSHADPFVQFADRIRSELIRPFALDLGGLLGAASFRPGPALHFPHFQVRSVGVYQSRADRDNLVLRVFEINPLACSRCGGEMRPIAAILGDKKLPRLLKHLGLSTDFPMITPARSPPLPMDEETQLDARADAST